MTGRRTIDKEFFCGAFPPLSHHFPHPLLLLSFLSFFLSSSFPPFSFNVSKWTTQTIEADSVDRKRPHGRQWRAVHLVHAHDTDVGIDFPRPFGRVVPPVVCETLFCTRPWGVLKGKMVWKEKGGKRNPSLYYYFINLLLLLK